MGNHSKITVAGHAAPKRDLTQKRPEDSVTLKQLRDAIPAHCFESSVTTSFAYLIRDVAYVAILVYLALQIDSLPNATLRFVAWSLYTLVQGFVFTGLWIIGHECGHGAFSKYPTLNNIVGWTTHSTLLVPYFAWQITHARHHRYTGNMTKDVVFVPRTAEDHQAKKSSKWAGFLELVEDTPAYTMVTLLSHQLFGWQAYLLFNFTRGKTSLPENPTKRNVFKNESHFDPRSALFTPAQRKLIVISDLGLLGMASLVYYLGTQIGFWKITLLYIVPYFWVHHWLVAITYLHHTHPSVPHYSDEKWTFTDGAICTVDRSLGFVGRHFFHEIIDYHVVHHLFTKIPFYKAEEATLAIIPLLGQRYNQTKDEWFLVSLYQTFRSCLYVSEANGSGILHWANPRVKKN